MDKKELEELKKKIIDYYGTGMMFNPAMIGKLSEVEKMTPEEIIDEAKKLKIIKKN